MFLLNFYHNTPPGREKFSFRRNSYGVVTEKSPNPGRAPPFQSSRRGVERGNDPVRKGLGGGDSDWAVKKLKSVN